MTKERHRMASFPVNDRTVPVSVLSSVLTRNYAIQLARQQRMIVLEHFIACAAHLLAALCLAAPGAHVWRLSESAARDGQPAGPPGAGACSGYTGPAAPLNHQEHASSPEPAPAGVSCSLVCVFREAKSHPH